MVISKLQNNYIVNSVTLQRRGFSLVEVTLAMAVISVSLLTLLGLLPGGLNTLREAEQQMMRAQISQKIAGKILLIPYKKAAASSGTDLLQYMANGPYFYDQAGRPLTNAVVTVGDPRVSFIATIEQVDTVYPGSARARNLTNYIYTIAIKVTASRGGGTGSHVIQVPNTQG